MELLWFILLTTLMAGYAILDGFDLGIGTIFPALRTDSIKRNAIKSIGPFWDGNEVWLITFGGGMFAAFPEAYATVFSGFYVAVMLLIFMLILRAIAIEFRNKKDCPYWRTLWGCIFSFSSTLIAFILGVAASNILKGVHLNAQGHYCGTLIDLLTPFSIMGGFVAVFLFAIHGMLYLMLKAPLDEDLSETAKWFYRPCGWMAQGFVGFGLIAFLIFTFNVFSVLAALAGGLMFHLIYKSKTNPKHYICAFGCSCLMILLMACAFAWHLWPNIILAVNPDHSMTLHAAASSPKTLSIMALVALVGMPIVIAYTTFVYWTFRGRVRPEE